MSNSETESEDKISDSEFELAQNELKELESESESDSISSQLHDDLVPDKNSKKRKLKTKVTKKKKKKQKTLERSIYNSTGNSSLDLSINIEPVGPVLQNKKHEILKTSKDGTKKNVCFYCFKESRKTNNPNMKVHFCRLVDHYESAHSEEDLIIQLMKIPKEKVALGQKKCPQQIEREKILEDLRNAGNSANNRVVTDVAKYVPSRRPHEEGKTVGSQGECYKCKKSLSLKSLHKHVRKCTGLSYKHRHCVQSSSRATMGDYHEIATEEAINIISVINEDDILDEIRYDRAIFIWLNAEASKSEAAVQHHTKIRASLRRLGRLKQTIKTLNHEIEELSDIFHEDYYDDFIEAYKIMGNPDKITKFMNAPATASDMCSLIRNVGNVYHVMIGSNERKKREEIDNFLNKVKIMWHSSIGNTIAKTQAQAKRNKIVNLPTDDDILCLRKYLEKQMIVCV